MLESLIEPIKTDSLKDVFVLRFEELILSGKVKIGQKLSVGTGACPAAGREPPGGA